MPTIARGGGGGGGLGRGTKRFHDETLVDDSSMLLVTKGVWNMGSVAGLIARSHGGELITKANSSFISVGGCSIDVTSSIIYTGSSIDKSARRSKHWSLDGLALIRF